LRSDEQAYNLLVPMNSILLIFRFLLCLTGIILALPLLIITVTAFQLPITNSGIGYLFGGLLLVLGLILAPLTRKNSLLLGISGTVLVVVIITVKLIFAQQSNTQSIKMITLPQGKSSRWIGYLIDEQDSLIFGETLFHRIGGDSVNEHENITSTLFADYSKMRSDQRVVASPFLNTYLNLQNPAHFDAVVIEPEKNQPAEFAVVFLHGYMGNVTAQCWEIAQAVKVFGAVTVCPSTDWTGAWWEPQGRAILQETFQYVRGRGIQKFYLGGFSNGGLSINRLASQLKGENGLAGLIFIDGIQEAETIRDTGLPVLVIQGTQDERVRVEGVRQVVSAIGSSATYVEFDADHFLIMKQSDQVQSAIVRWLEKFEPALQSLPVP
jgi:pimeloyl-ACP methyl ester carboxylesterase